MKYKTLFRIICKAIGVYFFVLGVAGVLSAAGNFAINLLAGSAAGVYSPMTWYYLVGGIGALFEIAAGCYLFFDGRLLADWAIPGNRTYCPECGYDLNNNLSGVCPECGTPTGRKAE
jgi:hypothetical protein